MHSCNCALLPLVFLPWCGERATCILCRLRNHFLRTVTGRWFWSRAQLASVSARGSAFVFNFIRTPAKKTSADTETPFLFARKPHADSISNYLQYFVPLLYCMDCTLFCASRFLLVVSLSAQALRNFSEVGSSVRVRRPISLSTGSFSAPTSI